MKRSSTLNQPYVGTVPPVDKKQLIDDQALKTAAAAPPEVRTDFIKALVGDTYARDNVDQYNKSKCGLDTSSQSAPAP